MRQARRTAPAPPHDSFAERMDMLLEELTFSIQARRPSILFAPFASEFIRAEVERRLAESLEPAGQRIACLRTSEAEFDLPLILSRHPERKTAVFSVRRLSHGGGKYGANAYKALNIRRELLVDGQIRAVFWLSSEESRQLSRHAPDFWAFRHRVIEFNRPSDINQIPFEGDRLPSAILREARKAARLAPDQAGPWLALGQHCLEFGLPAPARKACLRGLALQPRSAGGWLGLGGAYRLGENYSDAIINYRQAIEIDPRNLCAHIALIACYRLAGQGSLADEQMELAWPLAEQGSEYQQAALASVCGDASRAVELLALALKKNLVRLDQLQRDPNMDFIRNDPAFLRLFPPSRNANPGSVRAK